MNEDTIAAISTAQGQGGIGVIRVSGEGSIALVEEIFKSVSGKNLKDTPGYTARFGKILDGEEELDEAVVLVFRAPHSYTGENVVEISCHGGLYITRRILRLVLARGARPAEPGEFTRRAFLNGKMDLVKAEAVMRVIEATGKSAARAAVAANGGAISRRIDEVKAALVEASAQLSVWADYPDDETFDLDVAELKAKLEVCKEFLVALVRNYDNGKALISGVDTAIVGAPNVGKSTLMNALSGFEKSIVTHIPGTTRDVVEETVNLGEVTLRISDTAGIRETNDPVEAIGVDRAKARLLAAELVLFVLDGSRELTDEEVSLLESVKGNNAVAIVNKTDLEQRIDLERVRPFVKEVVQLSAKEGCGLERLEDVVLQLVASEKVDPSEGILQSERQYLTVKKALSLLEEAVFALEEGLTLDAVTVSINAALDELLALTGERATQVVVDEIFSKFCVGK